VAADLIPDTEWSLREWLRAQLPTIKVWFDVPSGTPTFPLITLGGRIGGAPDQILDHPRMSFSVWGGPGGNGRKLSRTAMSALVELLNSAENIPLDADTFAYGAVVDSVLWLPDESDPDNRIARYVVDASFTVRSI